MSDHVAAPLASEILAEDHPRGNSLKGRLLWWVETVAIVLMVFLVALVLANSLGRYLFSRPLPWSEEVVTALLMWLGALGITIAALKNELISCNILTRKLTGKPNRVLTIFHAACGIALMAVLGWFSWKYLGIFGADGSPILGIPKAVAISGLLATAGGLIVAFAFNLFETDK